MSKKQKVSLEKEEEYAAFLKKRLESANYKANVTEEEYAKTKAKYDKVKLVIRFLK
jgi:hypothetical protein